ncbi:MAG: hypothetical protein ACJAR9_000679 [Celeribacter sp.]|jgi:hypothetical protein
MFAGRCPLNEFIYPIAGLAMRSNTHECERISAMRWGMSMSKPDVATVLGFERYGWGFSVNHVQIAMF